MGIYRSLRTRTALSAARSCFFISFFKEEPKACSTDKVSDSVCYAELVSLIEEVATNNPCALIERLAKVLLEKIEKALAGQVSRIDLRVSKERPPIPDLLSPVSFSISREVP